MVGEVRRRWVGEREMFEGARRFSEISGIFFGKVGGVGLGEFKGSESGRE